MDYWISVDRLMIRNLGSESDRSMRKLAEVSTDTSDTLEMSNAGRVAESGQRHHGMLDIKAAK
jgi:hypothetical protein